ncbi:hypothetical protein [Curtobacterium ammoniigenes]|uniref:hypothetical protein n=1 Tax=Curtobacterium ammoniigenes TaxID=395387 RepID=UPI000ADA74B0|nr:hypothetical protein [Curtobacterium ammoniigenes]
MADVLHRSEPTGVSALADRLFRVLRIDMLAGGRHWRYRIEEEMRQHPSTARIFRWVRVFLAIETLVGIAALVVAIVLARSGVAVPLAVWLRATVVLLITLSLYVFAWRAQLGYWWAFSRLQLFSVIFPAVTLVLASIPGLYPMWMIAEQIIFAGLMLVIAGFLHTKHMRAAYPKPSRERRPGR